MSIPPLTFDPILTIKICCRTLHEVLIVAEIFEFLDFLPWRCPKRNSFSFIRDCKGNYSSTVRYCLVNLRLSELLKRWDRDFYQYFIILEKHQSGNDLENCVQGVFRIVAILITNRKNLVGRERAALSLHALLFASPSLLFVLFSNILIEVLDFRWSIRTFYRRKVGVNVFLELKRTAIFATSRLICNSIRASLQQV